MVETHIKCPNCSATFDIEQIKEEIKNIILRELDFKPDEIPEKI